MDYAERVGLSHACGQGTAPRLVIGIFHPPVLGTPLLSVARGKSSSQYDLVIALRLKRNESLMVHGLDYGHRMRVLVERKRLVQSL